MKNLHSKRFAIAIFIIFAVCFSGLAYRSGKNASDLWSVLKIAYKTIPLVLLVVGVFVSLCVALESLPRLACSIPRY